jgi:hypothetical protein
VRIENASITPRQYNDAMTYARTLWQQKLQAATATATTTTTTTPPTTNGKSVDGETKRTTNETKRGETVNTNNTTTASSNQLLSPLLQSAANRAFARVLHVSYHRRQHYNSVRSVDDLDDGDVSPMNWIGPIQFQVGISYHVMCICEIHTYHWCHCCATIVNNVSKDMLTLVLASSDPYTNRCHHRHKSPIHTRYPCTHQWLVE